MAMVQQVVVIFSMVFIIKLINYLVCAGFINGQNPDTLTALELYFGHSQMPPMINGSFSDYATLAGATGDSVVLNCTADYGIEWIVPEMLNGSKFSTSSISNGNKQSTILRIENISATQHNTTLQCRGSSASRRNLSSTVLVQTRPSVVDSKMVYAIRSSLSRFVATSNFEGTVKFLLELDRNVSFKKDLLCRWWRRFESPFIRATGGANIKLLEYAGTFWTSLKPTQYEYVVRGIKGWLINWTPTTSTLRTFISLDPKHGAQSGNYTVKVTDRDGNVYFSKTFQLIVISRIVSQDVQVFPIANKNEIGMLNTSRVSGIVQQLPLNKATDIQANKTYLVMCEFGGNPISIDKAFITKHKYSCARFHLDPKDTRSLAFLRTYANNKSTDGSACDDFSQHGRIVQLQPRIGTSTVILTALIEPMEDIYFSCAYKLSSEKYQLTQAVLLVNDIPYTGTDKGVAAFVLDADPDEIIEGENVTVRCIVSSRRYHYVFWKIHERYLTFGDHPDPGYILTHSVRPHSKILDLTILNITISQSGSYTCHGQRTVTGFMMDTDVDIHVNVQEPEKPYFGTETTVNRVLRKAIGDRYVSLYCDPRGQPMPTVKWSKKENAIWTVISREKSLIIPTLNTSSAGFYQCEIRNKLGESSMLFDVEIYRPRNHTVTILIACLIVASIIALALSILAMRLYKRMKWMRHLKAFHKELRLEAESCKLKQLNPQVAINWQIDALPPDFRYEIKKNSLMFCSDSEVLGSGASGIVTRAKMKIDARMHGEEIDVAIKQPIDGSKNEDAYRHLVSEMKIMMHLGYHVNVLPLLGMVTKSLNNGILYAIVEFCEKGSLLGVLKCRVPECTKQSSAQIQYDRGSGGVRNYQLENLYYAYQIAGGLAYLASKNLIHFDLAARNVLVTDKNILKIADFGLSVWLPNDQNPQQKTKRSFAKHWSALEVIAGKEDPTVKSDVWSLGIVLCEIWNNGTTPYQDWKCTKGHTSHEVCKCFSQFLEEGHRLTLPATCPKQICVLIKECWKEAQNGRPSAEECQKRISEAAKEIIPEKWAKALDQFRIVSEVDEQAYYHLVPFKKPLVASAVLPEFGNHSVPMDTEQPMVNQSNKSIIYDSMKQKRDVKLYDKIIG